MTNCELLHNKRIANVYDGRPDGSVLIRLDDRTEILIRSGAIMQEDEAWPLGEREPPAKRAKPIAPTVRTSPSRFNKHLNGPWP